MKQMLAEQALEHSASKTAQLHSKVNAQEVRKSNNIIIIIMLCVVHVQWTVQQSKANVFTSYNEMDGTA